MTATDIIFGSSDLANQAAFAALSRIEDIARITSADIDDGFEPAATSSF
jgi:hypothetical protein